jgi:hypothetical protein
MRALAGLHLVPASASCTRAFRRPPTSPSRSAPAGTFDQGGESVERGPKLIGGGGPGSRETLLVGQLAPVVRVGDPRALGVNRVQFPTPEVPRRYLPGLGRCPGDPSALLELDNVILPDAAAGGRHHEHVTYAADPLPGRRLSQVVVAVPAWLLSRIRDELEDLPRPSRELATGADNAGNLFVTCHPCIEAPEASGARRRGRRPAPSARAAPHGTRDHAASSAQRRRTQLQWAAARESVRRAPGQQRLQDELC